MSGKRTGGLLVFWMAAWLLLALDAFGIHNSLFLRERFGRPTATRCASRRDPHRGVCRDWEKRKAAIHLEPHAGDRARKPRENAALAAPIYARSRWLEPALRLYGVFIRPRR